jgi:predicted Zn-dependent peptidase
MREREYVSENGVRIFSFENPAQHGFYLSLFVRAGSIYENESESGITHFLEHALIRNVHHLMGERLYAELDRYGLEFNASTYNEMVHFYVSGAKEHFARGAEILCRVFSEISLPKSEIDLERLRIKAEIREGDEKNSLAAFTLNAIYPDSPLKNPIVGTLRSVSSITGRKLEAYRKSIFTKENLFFYATGAVGEGEIASLMEALRGYDLPHGEKRESLPRLPEAFGRRGGSVFLKSADFTMLRFNFDVDMSRVKSAELDLLYDLLLSGYGARFFVEMSEKRGLFYDISGGIDRYKNAGLFYFSF